MKREIEKIEESMQEPEIDEKKRSKSRFVAKSIKK